MNENELIQRDIDFLKSVQYLIRNYNIIEKAYGIEEWLAIKDDVILSHRKSPLEVYSEIKRVFGENFICPILSLKIVKCTLENRIAIKR